MTNKETFESLCKTLPNLYYRDDSIALFHGDTNLFLELIPEKIFKQIPTDPPFGIEYKSGQRKLAKLDLVANDHEFHYPMEKLWNVLRDDGSMWVFYSWKVRFEDPRIKNRIIWDKGAGQDISGMGDLDGDLANVYEDIAFIPKPDFKPYWDKRPDNIIRDIRKVGTKRIHLTQKPVKLMDRLIKWGSQPGDLILEPFAGSGTTARACQLNGRYCIMFEKLESNCKKIKQRFNQMELQFGDEEAFEIEEVGEQEIIEFYDGTSIVGEMEGTPRQ